jgi:hypothetical protein
MENSAELKTKTLDLYGLMSQGKIDSILSCFSKQDGLLSIGTDSKEWWHGHKTLRKILKAQFGEMGQIKFSNCEPEAYSEGTVGWAADRPTMNVADDTIVSMRISLVFHQEDSDWKVVQMHWSIGIDNEAALGKELTTE